MAIGNEAGLNWLQHKSWITTNNDGRKRLCKHDCCFTTVEQWAELLKVISLRVVLGNPALLSENRKVKLTKVSRTCSLVQNQGKVCTYPHWGWSSRGVPPKGEYDKAKSHKTTHFSNDIKPKTKFTKLSSAFSCTKSYSPTCISSWCCPTTTTVTYNFSASHHPVWVGAGLKKKMQSERLAATHVAVDNRINHCDTV